MPFLVHHAINIAPTCPNIAWLRPNMAPAWPHNRVFIEALKFRLKWGPRLWGQQKPNNNIATLPASNWLIISFASIFFTMSLNHLAEGLSDRGPADLLDCSACCLCKDGGPFHPIHLFRCCPWSHTNPLQGHHGKGCYNIYNGAGLAQLGYLWLLYISAFPAVAFQTDGNFGNPESIWINLNQSESIWMNLNQSESRQIQSRLMHPDAGHETRAALPTQLCEMIKRLFRHSRSPWNSWLTQKQLAKTTHHSHRWRNIGISKSWQKVCTSCKLKKALIQQLTQKFKLRKRKIQKFKLQKKDAKLKVQTNRHKSSTVQKSWHKNANKVGPNINRTSKSNKHRPNVPKTPRKHWPDSAKTVLAVYMTRWNVEFIYFFHNSWLEAARETNLSLAVLMLLINLGQ